MSMISRRQFMKKAVITGAAISAFPMVYVPKSRASWTPRTTVHPNVDNLRVVGISDNRMTQPSEEVTSWKRRDELVNGEIVWENIDKLACALTETQNPKEAWRTIFIKPPRKSWSDTVVAIKTNNILRHKTRDAVMAKICHSVTGELGVKPSNIHIYDNAGPASVKPFAGLPEGCRVEQNWGQISTKMPVHRPWSGGETYCVKHLVNGSIDILINIALSNRHWSKLGGFTMTMKNHFGTFAPLHGHMADGLDYLIAINQTPELLGPIDTRTGKILYPRQQLCIVDALWASNRGAFDLPTDQTNFLAMGVLSPVVDYQVATKFRAERMGWPVDMRTTRRMLTDFGFEEAELPNGGKIIEA